MFKPLQQFLEAIPDIDTIDDLEALLAPTMRQYRIEHYICTSMYGLPCVPDRKPIFGTWQSDWLKHFVRNGYYIDDPIAQFCGGLEADGRPYYWSELVEKKELTKNQYRIFNEAWQADLHEGLVVPLQVSKTELAMMSMAGLNFHRDPVMQGVLNTIAIQAHRSAREILMRCHQKNLMPNLLTIAPVPKIDQLTKKERQVIAYLSEDMRAPEIAKITDTTISTVRKHLASAKRKLGVSNTEALVATALRYKSIN